MGSMTSVFGSPIPAPGLDGGPGPCAPTVSYLDPAGSFSSLLLLVEGTSSIKEIMHAPKIATTAALSLTTFSSTATGFSPLRSVWPAFVTTATSSWSDGHLPLFGSCHLHQPNTNHGHSSVLFPRMSRQEAIRGGLLGNVVC